MIVAKLIRVIFLLILTANYRVVNAAQEVARDPARQLRDYRDFAMGREGNPARGRELFESERLGCVRCHSLDGSGSKTGPDLFAVGDKFPRSELMRAVLEPSAEIAVGYAS